MNRVFRLGVVESLDAPYHYPCFIEPSNSTEPCKPGISGEIWTLIAQRMNWTLEFVKADAYGGYEPDEKGNFSGILGMIQNGSIDGTLSFQSLRPARYAYFKYTEVAQTYESGLIIGENIEAKSEIQVQVFEWSIVGLIVGSLLVIYIYQQFILNCLTPSSSFFHNWINVDPILLRFYRLRCSLPNAVLAIAFTLINILYFAEFRSQVMFARLQTSDERFDDFFADKSRKVIVWSAISLTEQHRTTIFGPQATQTDVLSRIVEMPSVENISEILCKNSNVAYYTE
uniref:Solute-binding protein family 3/N-terminal domain-containing protein n=2 Tax=Plectus sambesii TaxID=2011161 RepID=A0A914W3H4_9BILA